MIPLHIVLNPHDASPMLNMPDNIITCPKNSNGLISPPHVTALPNYPQEVSLPIVALTYLITSDAQV